MNCLCRKWLRQGYEVFIVQRTCLTIPVLKRLCRWPDPPGIPAVRRQAQRGGPSLNHRGPLTAVHVEESWPIPGHGLSAIPIPLRRGPAECFSSVSALIGNAQFVLGGGKVVQLFVAQFHHQQHSSRTGQNLNERDSPKKGAGTTQPPAPPAPCNPRHMPLTRFRTRLLDPTFRLHLVLLRLTLARLAFFHRTTLSNSQPL
ncbi:hypothetical protein N658DRAFT_313495 [Parathielavia hyrcaniae]|uniref:Uncharacterized protein n=1 Tax=Parathielavia hyrcaniae TaxID=113614 RepID=A0AAN6PST0_9PEZI|nr:hypothetical protein N658DRAFT_313495 [Parathielavia hyrcaniae]